MQFKRIVEFHEKWVLVQFWW